MEGRKSNRSLDSKSEKKPFIVDCVSAKSKMPEYDGLRDANLRAYFSSKRKRKLLVKVNTKGEILQRGSDLSKTSRGREANSVRKDSLDFFHSPEPSRSVYVMSQRSQSVKVNKTGKKLGMKPVTHGELQELFEKYKPKDVVPELPANPTEDVSAHSPV